VFFLQIGVYLLCNCQSQTYQAPVKSSLSGSHMTIGTFMSKSGMKWTRVHDTQSASTLQCRTFLICFDLQIKGLVQYYYNLKYKKGSYTSFATRLRKCFWSLVFMEKMFCRYKLRLKVNLFVAHQLFWCFLCQPYFTTLAEVFVHVQMNTNELKCPQNSPTPDVMLFNAYDFKPIHSFINIVVVN